MVKGGYDLNDIILYLLQAVTKLNHTKILTLMVGDYQLAGQFVLSIRGLGAQKLSDFSSELAAIVAPLFGGSQVFHAWAKISKMKRLKANIS